MTEDDIYDGKRFVPRDDWTYIEKTVLADLRAKVERLEAEKDEAERLLRITGAQACGEPTGDQSLAFLREGHSPELADIAIAIDLVLERLQLQANLSLTEMDQQLRTDNERLRGVARRSDETFLILRHYLQTYTDDSQPATHAKRIVANYLAHGTALAQPEPEEKTDEG